MERVRSSGVRGRAQWAEWVPQGRSEWAGDERHTKSGMHGRSKQAGVNGWACTLVLT